MARKKQTFKPHIVHHRHTFKLLPKHHTSYSMLAFMLLLSGIFSIGWTAFASGAPTDTASFTVRAKIPAEPLTEGATIDKPEQDQRFTDQLIVAEGDCPDNSYVSLFRNEVFAGTALCVDNRWSIDVSLVAGENELRPQAYNITDDAGPDTDSVTVFYDPPLPPEPEPTVPGVPAQETPSANPSQPTKPSTKPAAAPLVLTGRFSYLGVPVGNQLVQTFSISGGDTPYAISIDWGDGTRDIVSQATAGEFTVSHTYTGPGTEANNSFIIKLIASDNQDQKASLQTMAIVTVQGGAAGAIEDGKNGGLGALFGEQPGGGPSAFGKFWQVAAPVYAVTTVAVFSFWLGEHRELELLRNRAIHRRPPHKHV